jgi:hypothetical protein
MTRFGGRMGAFLFCDYFPGNKTPKHHIPWKKISPYVLLAAHKS